MNVDDRQDQQKGQLKVQQKIGQKVSNEQKDVNNEQINNQKQENTKMTQISTLDQNETQILGNSYFGNDVKIKNDPLKRVVKTQMIEVKFSQGQDKKMEKVEVSQNLQCKQNRKQEERERIEQVQQEFVEKIVRQGSGSQRIESGNESIVSRQISVHLDKDYFQIKGQEVEMDFIGVKVEVKEIKNKNFSISKSVSYQVNGYDKHGKFEITRNIHEFESLRRLLIQRWPGMFIPKILQGQQVNQGVRVRHQCRNLQDFIVKLSYEQELYYKQQMQLFLRCLGVDYEQMCSKMPVLRVDDIIERYVGSFGDRLEGNGFVENSGLIQKFVGCLKRMGKNLQPIQRKFRRLGEIFENYKKTFPKYMRFLKNYEQMILSNYMDDDKRLIVLNENDRRLNGLQRLQREENIFYEMYFMMNGEIHDCQSLNYVILAVGMFEIKRDGLDQEIKQTVHQIQELKEGHKNMRMMTGRVTREELLRELEGREERLYEQKRNLIELIKIVEGVIANVTIPVFKRIKKENYFSMLKKNVEVMRGCNGELEQMWRYLLEESKCQIQSL